MKYIAILLLCLTANVNASSILDYGCLGDASTDNVVCINMALDEAAEGTTVLVPTGVFLVSGTVHVPEYVTLLGENSLGSVIEASAGFPDNTPVISMTADDGICLWTAIKNLRVKANQYADIGIYSNCVNESGGLWDVNIENANNIGVWFESTNISGPNHYSLVNVNIYRFSAPDDTDRGILIDSKGGKAWVIQGISVTTRAHNTAASGSVAIEFIRAHNVVMSSVHFEGWDVGISLKNTRSITIINAHGHNSMNDNGAAIRIGRYATQTVVMGLGAGWNPEGYKAIDDLHTGNVITNERTTIYVSE